VNEVLFDNSCFKFGARRIGGGRTWAVLRPHFRHPGRRIRGDGPGSNLVTVV
jgi:hypothetical protein